jgi:hypothetical protein
MKNFLTILLVSILFYNCSNSTDNSSIIVTDVERRGLKGKVKSIDKKSYEVKKYEFGEPVFELFNTVKNTYNSFGYKVDGMSKREGTFYNNLFKESIDYLIPEIGLISTREYESTTDGKKDVYTQTFKYDSITNKLVKRTTKNINKFTSTSTTIDYGLNQTRITRYDNILNELQGVTIEKIDKNERLLSSIDYDADGVEIDERHIIRIKNGLTKDSIINRFDDGEIYYVGVRTFDNKDREIKYIKYDDEIEGFIIDYDNNDVNSSYAKKEFKGLGEIILKKLRVEKTLDKTGNVVEEKIINLDNNKFEEKTITILTYF